MDADMLRYPVILTREDGKILVSVPDLPGVQTYGDDEQEALARAVDAIESMLIAMIDDRDEIPRPSALKRRKFVDLPVLTEAKVGLHNLMLAERVGKAELARRLDCHLPQIDRLLDIRHGSKLGQIERAFAVLGKQLRIAIEDRTAA
jgi:antitoxin HicB